MFALRARVGPDIAGSAAATVTCPGRRARRGWIPCRRSGRIEGPWIPAGPARTGTGLALDGHEPDSTCDPGASAMRAPGRCGRISRRTSGSKSASSPPPFLPFSRRAMRRAFLNRARFRAPAALYGRQGGCPLIVGRGMAPLSHIVGLPSARRPLAGEREIVPQEVQGTAVGGEEPGPGAEGDGAQRPCYHHGVCSPSR
jgi:hypothetical protein